MRGNIRVEMCNFRERELYITAQRNFSLPGKFRKNLDFCWLLWSWKHNLVYVVLLVPKPRCHLWHLIFQKQAEYWHRIMFAKVLSLNQFLGPRNMSLAELELLGTKRGYTLSPVYSSTLLWPDLCVLTLNLSFKVKEGQAWKRDIGQVKYCFLQYDVPYRSHNDYQLAWLSLCCGMGGMKGDGTASKVPATYGLCE